MPIEELGAWGELLGGIAGIVAAIGVMGTLLYLAVQVKANTAQVELARTSTMTASSRQAMEQLVQPGASEVFIAGCEDFESLNDADKFRFHVLINTVLDDNLVYLEMGDVADHAHIHRWLADLFAGPGVQQWWERNPYKHDKLIQVMEGVDSDEGSGSLLEALLGNRD
jgi:hypothetical protein